MTMRLVAFLAIDTTGKGATAIPLSSASVGETVVNAVIISQVGGAFPDGTDVTNSFGSTVQNIPGIDVGNPPVPINFGGNYILQNGGVNLNGSEILMLMGS